ncbi:uncharacterized protein LOC141632341 [Silene latifolia]|uniref:uncharacterized protein LOC141632341 n=1 Tax=Silene latifolia TaxID=37657 RepID=UPI003D77A3B5
MGCITGSWFSIKLNGSVHGFFPGKSGIRQGDPLSPYLFVLSMEILSRYMRTICSQPQVSLHPKCSKIGLTHLVFADDLMIFILGDVPSIVAVAHTLTAFAAWSRLHANTDKTDVYFGGVQQSVKNEILRDTGFSEGTFPFRYLGLPLNTARNTVDMYGVLINKIQASVQHWSSTSLSYAGKIQLLNSVIFGLENFWCANALLPHSILKLINKICKNFFWTKDTVQRKMVMKSWASICSPKAEGEFNVKELLSWNKALICKWLCILTHNPSSLWCSWNRAYNLSNCSIWDLECKDRYSESFISIISIKNDLITKTGSPAAASDLLHSWYISGQFRVQHAYEWFRPKYPLLPWIKALTHHVVVPCHGLIASMASQERLATTDHLIRRGMQIPNRCVLCKLAAESHGHLFFHCSFSAVVWSRVLCWMNLPGRSCDFKIELVWCIHRGSRRHWKHSWFLSCLTITVYSLWKERNRRIFSGHDCSTDQLVAIIKRLSTTALLSRPCLAARSIVVAALHSL